jgi:hypothetical protein
MRKIVWAGLALVTFFAGGVGGFLYAKSIMSPTGYVCPLTGETLPCPNCCPLNQN